LPDRICIVGATSAIARSLCHVLSKRGCELLLAGRDTEHLERIAADCRLRYGVPVATLSFDALDFSGHAEFVASCFAHFQSPLTGVVLCHGWLPDQKTTEQQMDDLRRTIDINFTSAAVLLSLFAARLEENRSGFLAAISSVAGDRGRQSNYAYGAAKAGLSAFLQGLRNRLHRANVHVLTIKPGFVDTPMTVGRINPRSPLVATPDRVARDIDRAIRKRKDVLYTPWFWRVIMTVVCSVPETLFKRGRM